MVELARSIGADIPIENTKISLTANDLTVYLTQTDSKGTTKRRTLILPLNLLLTINEHYTVVQDKLTLTNYIVAQT